MNTYKTSEVAKLIGIHPNTVRLYENAGLISKPERQSNGYRIFTDLNIEQFRLARLAFQMEVLQNGLRKKAVRIVKTAASCDFPRALVLAEEYLAQIRKEQANAEEAVEIVTEILSGGSQEHTNPMKRREVSRYLGISMDALRNWEMNGLLTVKRRQNGYRIYTSQDIQRLKIIRSLRCANYSLESILRLLGHLSKNPGIDIKEVLDTPNKDDEIIAVCDKLVTSLLTAENNVLKMICSLKRMKKQFS